MRSLSCLLLVGLCVAAFAAAPPAKVQPEVLKLIDQLGDDDADVRKEAEKKLTALGEDFAPVLRRVGKAHADIDVRLRALVIVAAIEAKVYGEQQRMTVACDRVVALALSPDGKRLASVDWHNPAGRVWDVRTGKQLFVLGKHVGLVYAVAWSPDGKSIATGGSDNAVRVWDAEDGQAKAEFVRNAYVKAVAFTPDGKRVIGASEDGFVKVWDVESEKAVSIYEIPKPTPRHAPTSVRSLAVMPDGDCYLAGDGKGCLRLIEVTPQGKVRLTIDGPREGARGVACSSDGKLLAAGYGNGIVRVFDARTGERTAEMTGHRDTAPLTEYIHRGFGWRKRPNVGEGVLAVAFSRDGSRLLSAGYDGTARIWDVATGKELQRIEGHERPVSGVAFLPGDRMAVTSSYDKTLRVWKLRP